MSLHKQKGTVLTLMLSLKKASQKNKLELQEQGKGRTEGAVTRAGSQDEFHSTSVHVNKWI